MIVKISLSVDEQSRADEAAWKRRGAALRAYSTILKEELKEDHLEEAEELLDAAWESAYPHDIFWALSDYQCSDCGPCTTTTEDGAEECVTAAAAAKAAYGTLTPAGRTAASTNGRSARSPSLRPSRRIW